MSKLASENVESPLLDRESRCLVMIAWTTGNNRGTLFATASPDFRRLWRSGKAAKPGVWGLEGPYGMSRTGDVPRDSDSAVPAIRKAPAAGVAGA